MNINDLKVDKFIDPFDSNFYNIRVSTNIGNTFAISGFGSDENEEVALAKAISEYYERLVFKRISSRISSTSNGYACHPDFHMCRKKALCEIIERDSVLTGWINFTAPYWLTVEDLANLQLSNLAVHDQLLRRFDFEVKYAINSVTSGVYTIIASLKSLVGDFGFVITSSASSDIRQAVLSNVLDVRRSANLIHNRRVNKQPIFKNLVAENVACPADHLEFYLNPKNAKGTEWFFDGAPDAPIYSFIRFEIEELEIGVATPWKLNVLRAMSSELQDYFVGRTTKEKINKIRNPFLKGPNFNQQLHPLA